MAGDGKDKGMDNASVTSTLALTKNCVDCIPMVLSILEMYPTDKI